MCIILNFLVTLSENRWEKSTGHALLLSIVLTIDPLGIQEPIELCEHIPTKGPLRRWALPDALLDLISVAFLDHMIPRESTLYFIL